MAKICCFLFFIFSRRFKTPRKVHPSIRTATLATSLTSLLREHRREWLCSGGSACSRTKLHHGGSGIHIIIMFMAFQKSLSLKKWCQRPPYKKYQKISSMVQFCPTVGFVFGHANIDLTRSAFAEKGLVILCQSQWCTG